MSLTGRAISGPDVVAGHFMLVQFEDSGTTDVRIESRADLPTVDPEGPVEYYTFKETVMTDDSRIPTDQQMNEQDYYLYLLDPDIYPAPTAMVDPALAPVLI